MHHEGAPTFDTLIGMLVGAYRPAYVLIDTDATYSCLFEEFLHVCNLVTEIIPGLALC